MSLKPSWNYNVQWAYFTAFLWQIINYHWFKNNILPPPQQITYTANGDLTYNMAFHGHNNNNDNLKCPLCIDLIAFPIQLHTFTQHITDLLNNIVNASKKEVDWLGCN